MLKTVVCRHFRLYACHTQELVRWVPEEQKYLCTRHMNRRKWDKEVHHDSRATTEDH